MSATACQVPGCGGRMTVGKNPRGESVLWCVACERRLLQLRWWHERGAQIPPIAPPTREVRAAVPERSGRTTPKTPRPARRAKPAVRERARAPRGPRRSKFEGALAFLPTRRAEAITVRELAQRAGLDAFRLTFAISGSWQKWGLQRERVRGVQRGGPFVYWRPMREGDAHA